MFKHTVVAILWSCTPLTEETQEEVQECGARGDPLSVAKACLSQGNTALSASAEDEAERAFKAALTADPSYSPARLALASLFFDRGDPSMACDLLEQHPIDDLSVLARLGQLQLEHRTPSEAARTLEKVTLGTLNAEYPEAYLHLGEAYVALGRTGDARTALERYLETEKAAEPERAKRLLGSL